MFGEGDGRCKVRVRPWFRGRLNEVVGGDFLAASTHCRCRGCEEGVRAAPSGWRSRVTRIYSPVNMNCLLLSCSWGVVVVMVVVLVPLIGSGGRRRIEEEEEGSAVSAAASQPPTVAVTWHPSRRVRSFLVDGTPGCPPWMVNPQPRASETNSWMSPRIST